MENKQKFKPDHTLKLMDQVKQVMRYHHYDYRTEKTYSNWIVRYIKYFGAKNHPKNMGKREIEDFLSQLATKENVSASTQRQALNAIIFLYRDVLDKPISEQIAQASCVGIRTTKSSKDRLGSSVHYEEGRMSHISSFVCNAHA